MELDEVVERQHMGGGVDKADMQREKKLSGIDRAHSCRRDDPQCDI